MKMLKLEMAEDFMFVKKVTQMDGTTPVVVITPKNIDDLCNLCLIRSCDFEKEWRVQGLSPYCKWHRCTIIGCGFPLAAFHPPFDQTPNNIRYCVTHANDH